MLHEKQSKKWSDKILNRHEKCGNKQTICKKHVEFLKWLFIFAVRLRTNVKAKVAQLVEHDLAKVGVAGSNPVFRSFFMAKN